MNKLTFSLSICMVAFMLMISSTSLISQNQEHPKPTIKNISELTLDRNMTPTAQNKDAKRATQMAAAIAKLEARQESGHTVNQRPTGKLNNTDFNSDKKGQMSNPKITLNDKSGVILNTPTQTRDVEELRQRAKARIAKSIKNLGKNN